MSPVWFCSDMFTDTQIYLALGALSTDQVNGDWDVSKIVGNVCRTNTTWESQVCFIPGLRNGCHHFALLLTPGSQARATHDVTGKTVTIKRWG